MEHVSRLKVTFYLALNVIVSISLIFINKYIYYYELFPNVSLTWIHFVVTSLGLCVGHRLNVFNVKNINLNSIFLLAFCFCGFVIFTNLSLEYNSVGVFQVSKMLTTPGVVLIQTFYYNKYFSVPVKLTLIPIIVGVALTFYCNIVFNFLGILFALLGVVITSLYQVLVNVKQSELQINSLQLLYYQAPLSAVMLLFCIPIVEPTFADFDRVWNWEEGYLVLASSFMAFFVNITTYWIIGKTSPLTYNMLGHMKFIFITLGGWVLFDEELTLNQWFGIAITFSGIVLYSHIRMREERRGSLLQGTEKTGT